MKLAVMLVLLSVGLTACGHSDYDKFVNNSVSDTIGVLALIGIVVFAVALFLVNRWEGDRRPPIGQVVLLGLWIFSMGAGISWAKEPDRYLTVTTPTTLSSSVR